MSPVCFVNHVPSTLRLLAPRFSVGLAKPKIHPESHRDGAHACNVFARRMKKHKPGATPVNVKLLLPPRQSRGFSQSKEDANAPLRVSGIFRPATTRSTAKLRHQFALGRLQCASGRLRSG